MTMALAKPRESTPSASTATFLSSTDAVKSLQDALPTFFRMVNDPTGEEALRGFDATKASMVSAVKFLLQPNNIGQSVKALVGRQFDAVREIEKVVDQAELRGWNNYHSEFRRAVRYLNDAFTVV